MPGKPLEANIIIEKYRKAIFVVGLVAFQVIYCVTKYAFPLSPSLRNHSGDLIEPSAGSRMDPITLRRRSRSEVVLYVLEIDLKKEIRGMIHFVF